MKTFAPAVLLVMTIAQPTFAAPSFPCSDAEKEQFVAFCGDRELVGLAKAMDAKLSRLMAGLDPLTRLLLRRDQRCFVEMVSGQGEELEPGERRRIRDALRHRQSVLDRLSARAGGNSPAGQWANAFGTIRVTPAGHDGLRVEIKAKADYQDDLKPLTCSIKAEAQPGGDGWHAASIAQKLLVRVSRQGETLRVLLRLPDDAVDTYQGCVFVTGSYFPVKPRPATAAAPAVSPSFDCAAAKGVDQEEICGDPGLARQDAALAQLYGDTLARVDEKLASHLRDDHGAWAEANGLAFESYLNPAWEKQTHHVHHTDDARSELALRLKERLEMLQMLDPAREGFAGLWVAHDAIVTIEPADNKPDGTLRATGGKWETGEYKAHCGIDGEGKPEGGELRLGGGPVLRRDGATLTVNADEPDQPADCSRMPSPRTRLFPVKAGAEIGGASDRIR